MVKTRKNLISFIIPVHNEHENLVWYSSEMVRFLEKIKISYELIYIDDGSTDDSLAAIKLLVEQSEHIRYISFSRNFGKEAATSAGLKAAKGDAAIIIDADGQHPIEIVSQFIDLWQKGSDIVIGVRIANQKEGAVKKYGSKIFYRILNSLTHESTIPGSTDFRLIDRKVINEFNKLTERNRITRGLIDWLGFKRATVEFTANPRTAGEAGYSFRKLVRLALHAFVAQSTKPLQLTGVLGAFVTISSALLAIFLALETYALDDPLNLKVTGTAIIALFVSFLVGIVLMCQWLLALYIESIHNEAQNRPLYVIDEDG